MIEIGTASARDILAGVPAPLDEVKDRRWQLRRELDRAIDELEDIDLHMLIFKAKKAVR
ncbi:MAG: hypothetical protein IR164_07700 [Devosia sp.]|uniref:hypothetical protein n=1 Tax=Devosia sp. TaxID=1871048 RepID=UPI0019F5B1D0|nr:hypothetical protein [Devosia sp.]MBF0678806.1 hypothetical protein [Devosia sp.]